MFPEPHRGQGWLPNLEMQRAALQQVEGSPSGESWAGAKRGAAVYQPCPWYLPASRAPRPVPRALGTGVKDEEDAQRGRKEAALLGELMV